MQRAFEDRKAKLENAMNIANNSYEKANLACEAGRVALEAAQAAFDGFEWAVPEKRTQESFKLLELSDEVEKDDSARLIEILSTTSANDWTKEQAQLQRALESAQRSFAAADKTCVSTRKSYFNANLSYLAYGGDIGEFESAQSDYVSKIQELKAPHDEVCAEE